MYYGSIKGFLLIDCYYFGVKVYFYFERPAVQLLLHASFNVDKMSAFKPFVFLVSDKLIFLFGAIVGPLTLAYSEFLLGVRVLYFIMG